MTWVYGPVVKPESTIRWEEEVSYLITRTSLHRAKHWLDFQQTILIILGCGYDTNVQPNSTGRTACVIWLVPRRVGCLFGGPRLQRSGAQNQRSSPASWADSWTLTRGINTMTHKCEILTMVSSFNGDFTDWVDKRKQRLGKKTYVLIFALRISLVWDD